MTSPSIAKIDHPKQTCVGIAYPRFGLIGNPGDALGGATVQATFDYSDWRAAVTVEESDRLEFVCPDNESGMWDDIDDLLAFMAQEGFSGFRMGGLLMAALVARLERLLDERGGRIERRKFRLSWKSTIPRLVGLAGSSALLTAGLRALSEFHGLNLSPTEQVEIVLACENDDIGIPSGPQDRVAIVYEGLTYQEREAETGELRIERLDPAKLPPLFVVVDHESAEGSEAFHASLRKSHGGADSKPGDPVARLSELSRTCRDRLKTDAAPGEGDWLKALVDENFDIRHRLRELPKRHATMVAIARSLGVHAKFAGSGGAIVGVCDEDEMAPTLEEFRRRGYTAFRAKVKTP